MMIRFEKEILIKINNNILVLYCINLSTYIFNQRKMIKLYILEPSISTIKK